MTHEKHRSQKLLLKVFMSLNLNLSSSASTLEFDWPSLWSDFQSRYTAEPHENLGLTEEQSASKAEQADQEANKQGVA